jgi:hypothetical protein
VHDNRTAPVETGAIQHSDSTVLDLDYVHAGHLAGYDHGRAVGQREASVDLARQWLHDLSSDFEALAISNAAAKGPHWQQAMREQSMGGAA